MHTVVFSFETQSLLKQGIINSPPKREGDMDLNRFYVRFVNLGSFEFKKKLSPTLIILGVTFIFVLLSVYDLYEDIVEEGKEYVTEDPKELIVYLAMPIMFSLVAYYWISTREYARKLKEANYMKDIFTDVLKHDILNPVGIALNAVNFALEERPNDKNLQIIKKNLLRVIEIVENASKLSKIESTEKLELQKMDLKRIIDGIVKDFEPLLDKNCMVIENKIDRSIPVMANPIISEIFTNYISNAIKYAKCGGKIIIDAVDEGNYWKIRVIDFGPGVPDKYKKVIFERFKRAKKEGIRGLGLGLAIVKRIAELHGGEVGVDDNPEGGSIFWVRLPKAK